MQAALRTKKTAERKGPRRSRGRPRLEDLADLEREILDVALNEFLSHGYGGTSMAMIVRKAGISKTTLYSRFSSKEALFSAIMQKLIKSSTVSRALLLESRPKTVEAGLRSYAVQALGFACQPMVQELYRLTIAEGHRFPELGKAMQKRTENVIDEITQLIAQCSETEGVNCSDPCRVGAAFATMLSGYHNFSLGSTRSPTQAELEDWAESTVRLFLRSRDDW